AEGINEIANKIEKLSPNILKSFKDLLRQNGVINLPETANRLDPNAVQTALNTRINSLNEANNNTLLKLDNGLDQIMLRVQMRKELADRLNTLPAAFVGKDQIGQLFENKL